MDERGVYSVIHSEKDQDVFAFSVDSFSKNPVDPVGAGDAFLAYSSLSLILSKSLVVSSIIGSIAASCECEKNGNLPISSSEIIDKLIKIQKSSKYSKH